MERTRVAFVGSGGAVKGVAHLGVFRAMEDLGLEPHILVGASAGAIASAMYAQDMSSHEIIRGLNLLATGREKLGPFHFMGFPNREQWSNLGYLTSGLFSIDRFERFLRKHLRVNDFRKLKRTLLVTAADVDGHGRVVFGKGYVESVKISEAVAASSCVPGLFRPFRIGDRYFFDGEVVRTLSLDLAVDAGADVVVVSNVYRPHIARREEGHVAHEGVGAVTRQALNIMLSEKEKRGIDLLYRLYPHVTILNVSADLGQFPFTGLAHVNQIISHGYREAVRVLIRAKNEGVFDSKKRVK